MGGALSAAWRLGFGFGMRICSAPRRQPAGERKSATLQLSRLQQRRSQAAAATLARLVGRDRTFQLLLLLFRNHHHRFCYRHRHHSQQRQPKQADPLGATTSRAHARSLPWRSHARRRRAPAPPSPTTAHLDRCPSCLSLSFSFSLPLPGTCNRPAPTSKPLCLRSRLLLLRLGPFQHTRTPTLHSRNHRPCC